MAGRIISNTARALAFVNEQIPIPASANMKSLAWEEDGEIQAAVLYENFNGRNVWAHIAGVPGSRWMRRRFLWYIFEYPFNEMNVDRITCYIEASNEESCRLCAHMGFTREATLRGAASDGGDAYIYALHREDCRFINTSGGVQ